MSKEKQIQEYRSKQLIEELSKMPPMVIATAYLHAVNYTLYGEDVTEKWITATQNASALEKAYRKGYYDALQRQAKSIEADKEEAKPKNLVEQTTDFLKNLYLQNKETIDEVKKQYEQYKADGILPQCMQEPWEGFQPLCSDNCHNYEIGEGGTPICTYDCERILENEPCHRYKTRGR